MCLWKGCVPIEGMCIYGMGVYLRTDGRSVTVCVPMERVCTYGRGV